MNDDELLAELRDAVAAADPPPSTLRDAAVRALAWDAELRELVAEVADVTFDSDLEPAGMRSADVAVRDLVFGRGEVLLDVTVEQDGDGTLLTGAVTGAAVEAVVVVQPGRGRQRLPLDAAGRFQARLTGRVAALRVPTDPELRTPTFSLTP